MPVPNAPDPPRMPATRNPLEAMTGLLSQIGDIDGLVKKFEEREDKIQTAVKELQTAIANLHTLCTEIYKKLK